MSHMVFHWYGISWYGISLRNNIAYVSTSCKKNCCKNISYYKRQNNSLTLCSCTFCNREKESCTHIEAVHASPIDVATWSHSIPVICFRHFCFTGSMLPPSTAVTLQTLLAFSHRLLTPNTIIRVRHRNQNFKKCVYILRQITCCCFPGSAL
jgi:hypothetical protein